MKELQGDFSEPMLVQEATRVRGTVTGGVRVRGSATLEVQGAVGGLVVIEDGAALSVQGAFAPDRVVLDGMLSVAGVWTGELDAIERGENALPVAVAGSIINTRVLQPDGTLTDYVEEQRVNITTSVKNHLLLRSDGRFYPQVDGSESPTTEPPT